MGKSSKGGSGKGGGSSKSSPMNKEAASRIQSAGARNAGSKTAQSGFVERAQSSADKQASKDRSRSPLKDSFCSDVMSKNGSPHMELIRHP
jgi:hypothetical protein